MATWMEAPIEGSEVGVTGEIGVLSDGSPSGIDPWIVLDAGIRPGATPPEDASPPIHQVIAAWRAADRELAGLVEGDPEWTRVLAEVVGLRALHHRLFEARMGESQTDDEPCARWTFAIVASGPAPPPAPVMA